jgi:hypothetical protein
MPRSVAARSLLSYAYAQTVDLPTSRRVLAEAVELTPRTPRDKLFLGHAIGMNRPEEGLPLMDEALAARPSGIGHVLRAGVRGFQAMGGSVADAEAAVFDADVAKRLLDNNPYSLAESAEVHLTAAYAYRKTNLEKRDEHLAAATREAEALAQFPSNKKAVQTRHWVSIVCDGLEPRAEMIPHLQRIRSNSPGPGTAFDEAYSLFCLGRDDEAKVVSDQFPTDRLNGHLRVLIALSQRNGRDAARHAWDLFCSRDDWAYSRFEAAPLLFAIGTPAELRNLVATLRDKSDYFRFGTYTDEDLAAVKAFLAGTMSEKELLSHAAANDFACGRQYYLAAWKRLGSGDRAGAEAAFQEAYDMSPPAALFWSVSRAVLIRMKDPDWPQAIKNQ